MATMTSTIYLCSNVPLSNRYDHTIYFSNESEQRSYFESKVAHTINDVSYLRKSWSIKVLADMGSARKWSYLFFQNYDTGKRWYYFVTDVEYINDNTVELSLELDVLQTYMFDWVLNRCFVEREHVLGDAFGTHTIDEGLDVGDLVVSKSKEYTWSDFCILIMSTLALGNTYTTEDGTELHAKVYSSYKNEIFNGTNVYAVNSTPSGATYLGGYINEHPDVPDSIMAIWMYPKELVTLEDGETWSTPPESGATLFKRVKGCDFVNLDSFFNERLDGYKPKNSKTLQYPYNFIYATNNVGGSAVYRYEHFGDHTDPRFNMHGVLSPEAVAFMYPLNYKGVQHHYDEGLKMTGFPMCSWNADTYKLWLAQNQNQQQIAMENGAVTAIGGAITAIAGIATGNVMTAAGGVGAALHGVNSIRSIMAQREDMQTQPPQARGGHSGGLNMVAGQIGYAFYGKTVDYSHAKAIDDFFTVYGYAVNTVKKPSLLNRPYWTYVKTRDSNVTGNIPNGDIRKINEIFDAGVTFWFGGEHVGDYTLDNSAQA